jgi:iron complex transport system substrate-binding protein
MKNVLSLIVLVIITVSCNHSSNERKEKRSDGMRIISLAPSITKELEELDMTGNIVGATSYCDITKENSDLIIGDAINVNIEKVLLLKPDVILTTALTKKSTIELFKENGIKIHVVGKLNSFDDICRQFEELGEIVGRRKKALAVIYSVRSKIDSLKNVISLTSAKRKVFIQIGIDPLFAVIPNTFMDDYIKFAGCENVTTGFEKGTISRETILNRNPDVILIATMGVAAQKEKMLWESFRELNAVKNSNVFIIDANVACVPTVKNFGAAFENIVNTVGMHDRAFPQADSVSLK